MNELILSRHYIAGRWCEAASAATFGVVDPADDARITTVPDGGAADASAAVDAAQAAFPAWRATPAKQRAQLLKRRNDLIVAGQDDLGRLISLEQGKPLAEGRGEVAYAASYVEWFAEEATRAHGETIPAPVPGRHMFALKEPFGVVAAITPWNFPAAMIARKIAPALAAGCTVVCKPAEDTPLTSLALVKLAEQAGLPPGTLNIVIYVQRGVHDRFVDKLVNRVGALKVGPASRDDSQIGPMINARAVDKIARHVDDAVAKGARVAVGGRRIRNAIADGPNYYAPTVLTGATTDMALSCEETFGPVAPIFVFDHEAEVITQANATPFGLAAYFYTRDIARARRVADALEVGIVGLNEGAPAAEAAPSGGVTESGYGREGSTHSLDDYLHVNYLCQGGLI